MTDDARKTRERIDTLLRQVLTLTQKLPQAESVREAAAPYAPASSRYCVARYPYSRFYALYDGDALLAVTVYKKGGGSCAGPPPGARGADCPAHASSP
jgi:hypothetical protein